MKHLLAIVAAVLLTGCSAAPTTTIPSGTLPADSFLKLVRDDPGTYYDNATDKAIVNDALMVCEIFNPSKGGSALSEYTATLKAVMSRGETARESGSFIVYAVSMYCSKEYAFIPGI